jgi:putative hydrolase of the HAD superfamily
MDKSIPVTTLFLDIGGVLLTNAWGHESRRKAADVFNLNYRDIDDRHHLNQVTYEEGKLTLDEYLKRVVFYEKRTFTSEQFREFMFTQTTPFLEMIEFIRHLKESTG